MRRTMAKTLAGAVAVLCVVSTLALAEEMTCSKDNGKDCIMVKDANGDEVEVMVSGVKAGDKLICTQTRDRMMCQKDPGKPHKETLKPK
jgi:hypothetical protein